MRELFQFGFTTISTFTPDPTMWKWERPNITNLASDALHHGLLVWLLVTRAFSSLVRRNSFWEFGGWRRSPHLESWNPYSELRALFFLVRFREGEGLSLRKTIFHPLPSFVPTLTNIHQTKPFLSSSPHFLTWLMLDAHRNRCMAQD